MTGICCGVCRTRSSKSFPTMSRSSPATMIITLKRCRPKNARQHLLPHRPLPPPPAAPKAGAVSYNRGKEQRAASARIRARIKALEKRLEEIDTEIADIESKMAGEEMGYEELQQLCEQLEALHTEQDADMEEWLSLSES